MYTWNIRDRELTWGARALLMGIVNATPDSFSDGGIHNTTEAAVSHALELVRQGADLLDIGGESTRPGAEPVSLEIELRRVVPVVQCLAKETSVPLSIDTWKAEVARQCLQAGAHIINDVTALNGDPEMSAVAKDFGAGVVLMHMQGTPATMQVAPHYQNVLDDIRAFLHDRVEQLCQSGLDEKKLVLDPGVGFGKTFEHNLELLARLGELQALGRPVLLGVSRKNIFRRILDRPVDQRVFGSIAIGYHAVVRKSAQVLRVHDVAATRDALLIAETLLGAEEKYQAQG